MNPLVSIQVDEQEVMRLCRERIGELVKEAEGEYVFWDSSELKKAHLHELEHNSGSFLLRPEVPKAESGK